MADQITALGAITTFVNRGSDIALPYQTQSAQCRPSSLIYPVIINRPRFRGRPMNQCSPTTLNIKDWSASFQVFRVTNNRIGCPLIAGSLNVAWDATINSPGQGISSADVLDTVNAFVAGFSNSGTYLGANAFGADPKLAFNMPNL